MWVSYTIGCHQYPFSTQRYRNMKFISRQRWFETPYCTHIIWPIWYGQYDMDHVLSQTQVIQQDTLAVSVKNLACVCGR